MKRILLFIPFSFLLIAGCNNAATDHGGGSPAEVLKLFLKALSEKNVQEAKKYATTSSESMIDMMQMSINNTEAPEIEEQFDPAQMDFADPVVADDVARVAVTDKRSGETMDFKLQKENGAWRVAFDMGSVMEMARDKMKEKGHEVPNLDSLLQQLTPEQERQFKSAMDSLSSKFDQISDQDIQRAKELLKNNPELKNIDPDKALDAFKKLQKEHEQ